MDTALTPPMPSTATPDRAAAVSGERRSPTRGRMAHGTSSPGRAAADVEPMTIVNVGHRAKTAPARAREPPEPMRSAAASFTIPQNPAAASSDSHRRSVIHTGRWASAPAR